MGPLATFGVVLVIVLMVIVVVKLALKPADRDIPYEMLGTSVEGDDRLADNIIIRKFYIPKCDCISPLDAMNHYMIPKHRSIHPTYPTLVVDEKSCTSYGWGWRVTVFYVDVHELD